MIVSERALDATVELMGGYAFAARILGPGLNKMHLSRKALGRLAVRLAAELVGEFTEEGLQLLAREVRRKRLTRRVRRVYSAPFQARVERATSAWIDTGEFSM